MATSQDPLAWRRQFCKGQWKEQEGEEDWRRDGKITSRNGWEWGLEIPWGQQKTGKDGKVLLQWHLWCPRRPPGLRDWDEMWWDSTNQSFKQPNYKSHKKDIASVPSSFFQFLYNLKDKFLVDCFNWGRLSVFFFFFFLPFGCCSCEEKFWGFNWCIPFIRGIRGSSPGKFWKI